MASPIKTRGTGPEGQFTDLGFLSGIAEKALPDWEPEVKKRCQDKKRSGFATKSLLLGHLLCPPAEGHP
jgi:hypothetical protein